MSAPRAIGDEPDWEEITSLEQFRARANGRIGVIVISDSERDQPIAHDRACPFVDEGSFDKKVLDGAGYNGRYWWAKNSGIAIDQLGARRCKHPGDLQSKK